MLPRLSRAGALGLLLVLAGASPATASVRGTADVRRTPVQAVVACVGADDRLAFGGAQVRLDLEAGRLARDDSYVVVPVDDRTGLDAGERATLDRRQRTTTVTVAADGTALTGASTVEVLLGGEVVQRIPVAPGCGVLDPAPDRGPVLGAITAAAGTVTVAVENGSSLRDEIGVTLFPVGGTSGPTTFLVLAPAAAGTVTFPSVAAGSYVVEAFGYTSLRTTRSAPFTAG